jgi:ferredoxin
MAFVITKLCIGVKDGACTEVCPVDAIHGREEDEMLFIDPDRCIDCDVCAISCPVNAIFRDKEVPEKYKEYIAINRDYFLLGQEDEEKSA